MKMGVETPSALVDINRLPLAQIEELSENRVCIGALARNSDVAEHDLIKSRYPVLSQALLFRSKPAVAQHGNCGRQSFAKDALLLLLRSCVSGMQ